MTPDDLPVIIVGAGPTGLVLALALAQQDVRSLVLATSGRPGDDDPGRTSITCLPPHAVATLERLGATGVERDGVRWTAERTLHGDRALNETSFVDDGTGGRPGNLAIATARLAEQLAALVEDDPRCELLPGRLVVALEPGAEQVVVRTASDGAGGDDGAALDAATAEHRASYVVLTTGETVVGRPPAAGTVRRFTVAGPVADDANGHEPDPGFRRVLSPASDPGGQVLTYPVPGGTQEVVGHAPHAPAAVVSPGTVVDVVEHVAPRFRDGRVLLAGPAAHSTAALTTLVSSAGIDDADDLAWVLARVLDGTGGDLLLDAYDAERRPVAEAELDASAAVARFLELSTGGLRQRLALAGARRQLTGTSVHHAAVYRDSPVLQPGCGAYAPELPVVGIETDRSPRALRDLRGGPFLVVAVGPTVAEANELALAVGAELVGQVGLGGAPLPPYRVVAGAAADATGDAETAGAALGNLLVVRPDGRLAWKVNGEDAPDEVAAALADALLRACGR